MRAAQTDLLQLLVMTMAFPCMAAAGQVPRLHWSQLPALPDKLGVAGSFAVASGSELLVAGVANFPDKPPWEGGKKVWHDEVYALGETNAGWTLVGKLPRPLAYGVAASISDSLLCIGGSDAEGHRAEVFEVRLQAERLVTEILDPLPIPLALAGGAVVGDAVYVACGATEPGEKAATNRVFTLNYRSKPQRWREIEPFPGKSRILSIAAAMGAAFYIVGGAALELTNGRVYLRDTWRYRPGEGWRRLADLPKPVAGAASPAPAFNSSFLVVGGDDGSLTGFTPLDQHPGFPRTLLGYDAKSDAWNSFGTTPISRATLPSVLWHGMFVLPSGEVRPSVRSPEVWGLTVE